MIPPKFPLHVTFFVNWACNLRCRECWLYGYNYSENLWLNDVIKQTMSFDLFKKVVSELLSNQPRTSFCLMGGEPYLHPELARMVQIVKSTSKDSYIDVNTNGTLLEERGEPVLAAGIDAVYVSLDGSCSEVNDSIRGKGSFDKAIKGIKNHLCLKQKYKTKIAINYTITKLNINDLPNMGRLAEELAVDELFVNFPIFYTADEGLSAEQLFTKVTKRLFNSWKGFKLNKLTKDIDQEQLEFSLESLTNMKKSYKFFISPVAYSNKDKSMYFTPTWKSIIRETQCPKLILQTTILPNGDTISCTPFVDTVVGNVSNKKISDVWQGKTYNQLRRLMKNNLTDVCYRCCDLLDGESLDGKVKW